MKDIKVACINFFNRINIFFFVRSVVFYPLLTLEAKHSREMKESVIFYFILFFSISASVKCNSAGTEKYSSTRPGVKSHIRCNKFHSSCAKCSDGNFFSAVSSSRVSLFMRNQESAISMLKIVNSETAHKIQ